MEQYIREIRVAVEGKAWLLALSGVLSLPDMCAAIESVDGRTDGAKYRRWIERWLGEKYPRLNPGELWQLRCSFLHQGRTYARSYERIVFTGLDRRTVFHNNVINNALNLDLPTFCNDMLEAVALWQAAAKDEDAETYNANLENVVRWYPAGLPPYIVGTPVLS